MFFMDKHHYQAECVSPPESAWKVQDLSPLEIYKHIREHKERGQRRLGRCFPKPGPEYS